MEVIIVFLICVFISLFGFLFGTHVVTGDKPILSINFKKIKNKNNEK